MGWGQIETRDLPLCCGRSGRAVTSNPAEALEFLRDVRWEVCSCTALGSQALPQPKHGCREMIPTAIKLQGSSHPRI